MTRNIAILLACLALLGCARSSPPAPVVYGQDGGTSQERTSQPRQQAEQPRQPTSQGERKAPKVERLGRTTTPSTSPSVVHVQADTQKQPAFNPSKPRGRAGIHTVKRGDTVYGIARRYQVPLRSVIDANSLRPPYVLRIGERLQIPVPRRHIVEKGDTLYGISRAYDVDLHELARINELRPPYTIKPRQVLIVPGVGSRAAATRVATKPDDGTTRTASASASDKAKSDKAGPNGTVAKTASKPKNPAPKQTKAKNPSPAGSTQSTEAKPASISTPAPKEIPKPPPRSSGRFLWPVKGDIITRFGPQKDGLHNDGINIAAARGSTIRAAENGVVAYIGNELRGFGNLLLIKHADGWITAYAHTDRILVKRGQKIRRGHAIARVGSTGGVSRPQLHFEVRQGSRAVDPLKVLGQQSAGLTRESEKGWPTATSEAYPGARPSPG
ncbi:LysM peptidoglycan-binding domain-containing M23 family metallopeptidase [Ferruginivarius sediminum]|nr:LysM peptidoglycan-binding domain-containing M23 family metallopeptidase [Ferruginivarius sediminum]